MRKYSSLFVLPFVSLSCLFVACGGSDDGASPDGGTGGRSSGSGGQVANAGQNQGSGGRATGGSSGVEVPDGTPLTDIDTNAEAEAACEQLAKEVSKTDFDLMTSGLCAIDGQVAELTGVGTCEDVQEQCVNESDPANEPGEKCTPDDFPECDEVTLEEYIACSKALLEMGADYFGAITCETNLEGLEEPATPEACVEPFDRCPEFASENGF